jgi:hypothetical protein
MKGNMHLVTLDCWKERIRDFNKLSAQSLFHLSIETVIKRQIGYPSRHFEFKKER